MSARRFSLRRRIGWWLLPPLALLLGVNALLAYRGALETVNRAYDRSLTASVKSVAERIHSLEGEIQLDIPYAALEGFEDAAQERIFHAVIDPAGRLLTGYEDLRPPQAPPDTKLSSHSASDTTSVRVTADDPREVVADLKSQDGSDIWLCGGGDLAAQLMGQIDRLVLKVNPFVFGDGIPLFAGECDPMPFDLVATRSFTSGVLINEYLRR